jgi:diguanylate cyclase (GGDEF)-like protein
VNAWNIEEQTARKAVHEGDPLLSTHIPEQDRHIRFLLDSGRRQECEAAFDDAIATAPNQVEPAWDRTVVLAHRALLAWRLGRIALALELAAEAWAEVDSERPTSAATAHALSMLGYMLEGHSTSALDLLATSVALARDTDVPETLAHCLIREATAYTYRAFTRHPEESSVTLGTALDLFNEGLSLATTDPVRRRALAGSASALAGLGQLDEAENRARLALESSHSAEDHFNASIAHWALASIRRAQGRLSEARSYAELATEGAENISDMLLIMRFSEDLASICQDLQDHSGAYAALQRTVRASRDTLGTLHAGLAQTLEQRRLAVQAQQLAEAAERAATLDPLTGLTNRLGFERDGSACIDRALARGTSPWLVLVDVDRFKEINDLTGHPTGDLVLQEVARLLIRECLAGDLLCRWAGDEFVALLPDISPERGPTVADRMRVAVHTHDWRSVLGGSAHGLTVSVSVGVATGSTELHELFAAADRALYRAKQAGRDRVEITADGQDAPPPDRTH